MKREAVLSLIHDAPPVTDQDAAEAVRLLLRWIGDDPTREGLAKTPVRFLGAWKEYFSGYDENPHELLQTTFTEVEGYNDVVMLENIRLESTCEHHLAPITGEAFIAYLPHNRVVGISKLARVMEVFAKRMQIQERLTSQIAHTIHDALQPRGVAVAIRAAHGCITSRGAHKSEARMLTVTMLGDFETDETLRRTFMDAVNRKES